MDALQATHGDSRWKTELEHSTMPSTMTYSSTCIKNEASRSTVLVVSEIT